MQFTNEETAAKYQPVDGVKDREVHVMCYNGPLSKIPLKNADAMYKGGTNLFTLKTGTAKTASPTVTKSDTTSTDTTSSKK